MLNQWFKLAIIAFVGIIVSSLTLGLVSGINKQSDPAAAVHGTGGGTGTNHATTTGTGAGAGATGNHGANTPGNVAPGYGPYGYPETNGYPGANGQFGPGNGPNGHPGPGGAWGPGYGPGPWGQYNGQLPPNGQGSPDPMGGSPQGQSDPMGGGMMNDKMEMNMKMKMGMM